MRRVVGFEAVIRRLVLACALLAAACGGESRPGALDAISRHPVSVRGWIADVKGAQRAETIEQEIARRTALFQAASVWVEKTEFASGGIQENGAFVILDVPPQTATIGFNAPGAETAQVILVNVPPSADVFIPDVVLEPNGASVLDPKRIEVRIPGDVDAPRPTGTSATVAGVQVPVMEVPLSQMTNRREFPNPGGFRPVATVK